MPLSLRSGKYFPSTNLAYLWLAQIISQCGYSMYHIGLLWVTLDLSNSEKVTGWIASIANVPSLIFALLAGVLADRKNRKKILLTSDGFSFLFILMIPLVALFSNLTPTWIAINAFLVMSAGVFFFPARDALIPQIVPTEKLLQANTFIQTSWQFSLLLGPALAGYLLDHIGKVHLFTIVSLFYLVSFIFVTFIKAPLTPSKPLPRDLGVKDTKEGLTFILRNPILLPLFIITILDNLLIMGPAIVGTPVFVREELKLTASAYASTEFCYAIGMLAGSVLMWKHGKNLPKGKTLLVGMFLDGITFIPVYFVQDLFSLQVTFVIHSFAIPLLIVPRAAMIQEIVPTNLTGRVFSIVTIAVVGMAAISAAGTGYFLEMYGARVVFLWIGIGGGLCGIIGYIWAKHLRMFK